MDIATNEDSPLVRHEEDAPPTVRGVTTLAGARQVAFRGDVFRKVLVVDDDPSCRRLISRVLDYAGYEVCQAADGHAALEACKTFSPDFVITDWNMPSMTGVELCGFLRKADRPRYLYVVILTARSSLRDTVRGIAAGADDVIFKPFRPGEVLSRLQAGTRILESENRLREMASRDPLTQLLNRRAFFEILVQAWNGTGGNCRTLTCAMIDIDNFKAVNDTYGHLVGDAALIWVSGLIKSSSRSSDNVCRFGGEEFAVLLPGTPEQGALVWAERCRSVIENSPLRHGGLTVPMTVSIGLAEKLPDQRKPEQLIDRADQALLRAKRTTKNAVAACNNGRRSLKRVLEETPRGIGL